MNSTLAWFGFYFFIGIALTAFFMALRKKEPKRALRAIGIGGTMLAGILFVTALGGNWTDLDMFHWSATVACVLFFSGLIGWALHHRIKR